MPNLPKLLKDSQIILDAAEKYKTVFQTLTLVSYRRGRNLNDMLSSKRIPSQNNANQEKKDHQDHDNTPTQPKSNQCPECGIILKNEKGLKIHRPSKHQRKQNATISPGFRPCNSDTRCDTCKKGLFCSSVTGVKNGTIHQIRQPPTCKSKNTCYLINCKRCNQRYTGETKLEFHLRLNNYTSDIRSNKKSTGVVRRFSECSLNNIQPTILEKVRSSDPFIRKAREQVYIELLETNINAQ